MADLLVGALSLAVAACGHGSAAAPAPDVSAAEPPGAVAPEAKAPQDLKAHMQHSFWYAIDARDALIQGDLARAKRISDDLSKQDYSTLPGDWSRAVGEMKQYAADAAMAPDSKAAALATAKVAVACGSCHERRNAHPRKIAYESVPKSGSEHVRQRMARHESAADDLWMGLVSPSQEAWKHGAIALRDLSPQPPASGGEPVDEEFAARLNEIKALGLRALSAATVEERAELYGDYLSRCATCHSGPGSH